MKSLFANSKTFELSLQRYVKRRLFAHFSDAAYWQAFILLSLVIIILISMALCSPPMDFLQFYDANKLFFHRQNPYELPPKFLTGFPYPPWAFLITSFFSIFDVGTACLLWSLLSLLLYMASIYLLTVIIFEKEGGFVLFPKIALAAALAPCLWSFIDHHLMMVLLFFITLTLWLFKHRRDSFWIGATSSFLLLKPHLTLITLILFFFQAPNRKRFLAGLLLFFTIQFVPFISGYRPVTDLKDMFRNTQNWATKTYVVDEQSLAAELMRFKTKPAPSLYLNLVRPDIMPPFNKIKLIIYLSAIIVALALFAWKQRFPILPATSLTLLAGLFFSPYSHWYDGVLLIPLALLTIFELSKGTDPIRICVLFFFINLGLCYLLPGTGDCIHWDRVGECSIIYSAIFAGMWFYHRCLSRFFNSTKTEFIKLSSNET
jgi:hypothetical protein